MQRRVMTCADVHLRIHSQSRLAADHDVDDLSMKIFSFSLVLEICKNIALSSVPTEVLLIIEKSP